jgi:hypothetical protein
MLFAFSGLDGYTDYHTQLIATTTHPAHGPGLSLHLPDTIVLLAETAFHWAQFTVEAALNDVLCFATDNGPIAFLAVASDTLAGCSVEPYGMSMFYCPTELFHEEFTFQCLSQTPELVHFVRDAHHYVLVRRKEGERIFFGFAYATDADAALCSAREAAAADIDAAVQARLASYERYVRHDLPDDLRDAYVKAASVLKVNTYSPNQGSPYYWVTPDRLPHRVAAIWDTIFQLQGMAYYWPERVSDLIRTLFHYQHDDGFIPHLISPNFLGPHIQPPIIGWGIWTAYQQTRDAAFLAEAYEHNRRYLNWIRAHRSNANGMLGWYINVNQPWCRCGESGMDNSPRFDRHAALDCVDLCCYVTREVDVLQQIERELGLPADEDLAAYGRQLAAFVHAQLWDEADGMFYDRDPQTGELTRFPAWTAFLPLWAGIATPEQVQRLREHLHNPATFGTAVPLPTVARSHPSVNVDYWRGGVWMNTVHLVVEGLRRCGCHDDALEVARRAVEQITAWHAHTGCLYELYHPDGDIRPDTLPNRVYDLAGARHHALRGVIRNYGWTASSLLCLVNEVLYPVGR